MVTLELDLKGKGPLGQKDMVTRAQVGQYVIFE